MKKFHFTIDCDFVPNSDIVFNKLLSFIDYNKLNPTFFIAGKFAEMYPSLVRELALKFEIGSHGLYHTLCPVESFSDNVSFSVKRNLLIKSTALIEKHSGQRPIIFRAPSLKISNDTFQILKELNYKIDSSIPSKRFDFYQGSCNSFKYFTYNNQPRFIQNGIFEIPLSAWFFPINMRFVKVFGIDLLISFIKMCFSKNETIVFYMHPSELVSDRSILEYPSEKEYFYKNGGFHLLKKLQKLIDYLKANEFESITMKENLKKYINTN